MDIVLELIINLFPLVYVIIFFGAVFVWIRFDWSAESKDERGQLISNKSYRLVFPIFPIGWFIIKLVDDYAISIPYETYKELIWFLLTGMMIIHAINITILRRRY